jgi:hypothetical protein
MYEPKDPGTGTATELSPPCLGQTRLDRLMSLTDAATELIRVAIHPRQLGGGERIFQDGLATKPGVSDQAVRGTLMLRNFDKARCAMARHIKKACRNFLISTGVKSPARSGVNPRRLLKA